MSEGRTERHLAAILAADVVGYSRLMEQDEADTFARFTAHRKELFEPEIAKHNGHIFKLMGDGLLAEFGSVVDAVECAVALQRGLAERNSGVADDRRIDVRIGVNLGDVIVEDEDRHGEGVIIAARLQALAEPGGIWLSQQAFDQVESKLDLGYEDLGEHLVKNIVKAVHVYRVSGERGHTRLRRRKPMRPLLTVIASVVIVLAAIAGGAIRYWPPSDGDLPPLPPGPKIAILPFANLSGSPEDDYFAVGLTENIATALSRFSDLFVFSLNATIQYKGEPVDPRRIGEDLGAQYVLEGSVWRSESSLRATARLLDARDAQLLWSNTYDRDLTAADIFAVLDEITEGVVATIGSNAGVIRLKEAENVRKDRTESLQAYDCAALTAWFGKSLDGIARARVRNCLEQAIKLDPNYAKAWSDLANLYIDTYKNETFSDAESRSLLDRADAAAKKATEIDIRNEQAYYLRAVVARLRGESYETFKALAVNPNNAEVVGDIGNFTFYSGEWERGKALVERMMKLNPRYPSWAHYVFFLDHYRKSEYPEALQEVLKINLAQHCMVQWSVAAAYGQVGETAKGMATLVRISKIEPPCPDDPRYPFQKRKLPNELVESLVDGLRKAGLDVPPAKS
jgi:TolB-like protein/class 3 adenylate cyclase